MRIEQMCQELIDNEHLLGVWVEPDTTKQIIAALKAGQYMRTQITKAGMIGREKSAKAWDAATGGEP